LRVCEVAGHGRGLKAIAAIASCEEVLRIPEDSLLNLFTALRSERFGTAARLLLAGGLHPDTVAMLFAVSEWRRCHGEGGRGAAPWADLLATAPSLDDALQLLAWPLEAVEALGSGQLVDTVSGALASLWSLCREVSLAIRRLPESVVDSLRGEIGFDDLLWAKCLFDSRAVSVTMEAPLHLATPTAGTATSAKPSGPEGSQMIYLRNLGELGDRWVACPKSVTCLAPGIDLLNHDARGLCSPPAFDAERRVLAVTTVAAVPMGAELCLCYGALQNFEFLLYYGFCPKENPHDRVTLTVDPPSDDPHASVREVMLRLHAIPTHHVLRPPSSQTCAGGDGWDSIGILPPQLLRCMRIFVTEDPDNVEVDCPPGVGIDRTEVLDVTCLDALTGLLSELLALFEQPAPAPPPLWWPIYGPQVMAFRESQGALLGANLAAVRQLRERLARMVEGMG